MESEIPSGIDPSVARFGYTARKARAVEAWKEFLEQHDQQARVSKFSVSPGVRGTITLLASVVLSFSLAQTVWGVFFLTIVLDVLALSSLRMKLRADILEEHMSRYMQFVREHPDHAAFIDPLKD